MTLKLSPIVLCLLIVLAANPGFAQDWNGGPGNWTTCTDWSPGCPGPGGDVVIYSGGNDDVTLDVSVSINSLMLGGPSNGFSSELTDGGSQTLNIATYLTVGQTGVLSLSGGSAVIAGTLTNSGTFGIVGGSQANITGDVLNSGFLSTGYNGPGGNTLNIGGTLTNNNTLYLWTSGDVANVATLVNNGTVLLQPGTTLNVAPSGLVTDIPLGDSYFISGTFNAGPNNAFSSLNSIEGQLYLTNRQTTNITPGSGTLTNSGTFVMGGSKVSITGDVLNNGSLSTVGGNTLNISDTLTNNGTSYVNGPGDVINVSTLTNSGTFGIVGGSQANITGDVLNSGFLSTGYNGPGGNTLNIGGTLTNNNTLYLWTSGDVANVATLVNNGTVLLQPGTTFLLGTGVAGAPGYYQFANGTLGEFIDMASFGVIMVATGGSVTLNGTLEVLLQNGYNPAVGSTYEFIQFTPGELSGVFASLQNALFNNNTEKWTVVYSDSGGYVELVAVANNPAPEPASLLLLGSGLLTLGYRARRRLRK